MTEADKRKRKLKPCFEPSVIMTQDKESSSSEIISTEGSYGNQAFNIQQPILLNQIPVVQNQQLVYQVEDVQNINNLNFPNGTSQSNFVYIVIPTTNENVQIETVPIELLKKDTQNAFDINVPEKSDSVIKQHNSVTNSNKFLANNSERDPLEIPDQLSLQHMQTQSVDGQKIQPQVYVAEPTIQFADVSNTEDSNNKTLRTHGYRCDYRLCTLAFSSIYEKKAHMDAHLYPENTEFKCNICNSVFSRASDRNKHVESHSVVNTYKCKNCQKDFPYYTSLVKHIDENTCIAKNNLYPCYFCGTKFVNHQDLDKHHQSNLKICVCKTKVCGEQSFEVHKNLCSVYKNKSSKCRKKVKMETPVIVLD